MVGMRHGNRLTVSCDRSPGQTGAAGDRNPRANRQARGAGKEKTAGTRTRGRAPTLNPLEY